ncbi:hypothetical protein ACFXJO_40465 [Streptomyces lavendulae]|uniref:hypothetical protein n=1 Tax=Streptomyces lavendulae TaxID=1914 RepID=UPI0036769C59
MNEFSDVPATPVYSLVISRTGDDLVLTLDGERLADGPSLAELRAIGRDRLTVLAALAGRPVRARAVDPEALNPWFMIVTLDGAIHDVSSHPAPPAAPAPPPDRPDATDTPVPAALPYLLVSVPEYREMWAAVWAHHAAGDLPAAVTTACKLEHALSGWFGEQDASTITVLTARAWLTLCQRTDWQGTTELLITTALRCHAARYRPETDTVRTARNAHAAWHLLRKENPEAAADLGAPLADMLAILGETRLADHVWEFSAARTG